MNNSPSQRRSLFSFPGSLIGGLARHYRAGLLLFAAIPAAAGFSTIGYTWPPGSQIVMHMDLNRPQVPLQDGHASWNASAEDALAIWNQYLQDVLFVTAPPTGPYGRDGENSVFFSNTIYGESWGTGLLAVTLDFSDEDSAFFQETEVIFNSNVNWNSYRGPIQGSGSGGTYDLHRVALHEFGHVLGLDHPDQYGQSVSALMNSTISELDHLTDDDIAGASSLYGLRLTSAAAASGSTDQAFSFQLTANHPDVVFSSTDLPAGLTVNPAGLISGTPAAAGNFLVHITLSRNGRSVTVTMTINIKASLRAIEGPTGLSVVGDEQAWPVGPNSFHFTPANGTFSATGAAENPSGMNIGVWLYFTGPGESWQIRFAAPSGVPLTVGRYEGLSSGGGGPAMNLTRNGGSSGGPGGFFEVKAIAYGPDGKVLVFNATFEMFTGSGSAKIRGEVRFSFDPAKPPGTPVITSPLTLQVTKGVPVNYKVAASNNPTLHKVHRLPAGLNYDGATTTISGIPASTGVFDIVLTAENSVGIGTGRLKLVVSAPPPPHTLQNIATRLFVGTDADVAIAGFILGGGAPKRMIVRAVGPSLTAAGVNGVLLDPQLEVRNSGGDPSGNSDSWLNEWEAIQQSGLPPSDKNEAAIVRTISGGAWTTIMKGGGVNRTGVGLIEVYDLDATSGSSFANISTRGRVKSGEGVMIGGFIIGGDSATRIVVRGIGPSLGAVGVVGALADPVLALHSSNGSLIQVNDSWRSNEEAIRATGLPPADDREAAILQTLAPGNYTVILSGNSDLTGVGLIEIYNLDAN